MTDNNSVYYVESVEVHRYGGKPEGLKIVLARMDPRDAYMRRELWLQMINSDRPSWSLLNSFDAYSGEADMYVVTDGRFHVGQILNDLPDGAVNVRAWLERRRVEEDGASGGMFRFRF